MSPPGRPKGEYRRAKPEGTPVSGRTGQRRALPATLFAAVALGSLVAPVFLTGSGLTVYILLGTSTMAAIGLGLLMGYAGQVSLGQGAFFAVGAYTAALISLGGLPTIVGFVLAPVMAGVLAAVVGIPILRLRGHYLAFATLALHMIILSSVGKIDALGGEIGLRGIPALGIGGLVADKPIIYAWLAWAATAVVLIVARNIITSRPGRGLRSLASSETAAAASGVAVSRYKLTVFAISGAFAGAAGAIYAFFIGYISPGSFPILMSIEFIVMAVVGGMRTVWGPVAGAAGITALVQLLNTLGTQPGMPTYAAAVFSYALYAVLLILILLFLPRGVCGEAVALFERRSAHASEAARRGASP